MSKKIMKPYRISYKLGRGKGEHLLWASSVGKALDQFREFHPREEVQIKSIKVCQEGEWVSEL